MASLTCFQAILRRKLHQHYRLFVSEVVNVRPKKDTAFALYSSFATIQPDKQDIDYR